MLTRLVSRLLIVVMLLTVFSPSFGWDATGGMAAHEHPVALADDHGHDHDHAAPGDACPGCDDHAQADCDEAQHHCCPGHVLGHMPGGLAAAPRLLLVDGGDAAFDTPPRPFSSRIPEGLERPPRVAA
ncbi:MAG: hypothetical protein JNM32_09225 [Dechloromonas sp.]|jgi:uncharacterized protein involved in copper resistance|nr:hypothetical protein [Dechloromonas sp.]